MLDKQIIKYSNSPLTHVYGPSLRKPMHQVNANGESSFRKLNELIDQDTYPLPNTDDILDNLDKLKLFSALDLSSKLH